MSAWPLRRSPRWLVLLVVAMSFAGLYLLGNVAPSAFPGALLAVVPIALCAIEFGVWGRLTAAILGLGLVVASELRRPTVSLALTAPSASTSVSGA